MEGIYAAIVIALILEMRAAVARVSKRVDTLRNRVASLESGITSGMHIALPHVTIAALMGLLLVSCGDPTFAPRLEVPPSVAAAVKEHQLHAPAVAPKSEHAATPLSAFQVIAWLTPWLVGLAFISLILTLVATVVFRSPFLGSVCVGEAAAIAVCIVLKTFLVLLVVAGCTFGIRWLYQHRQALKALPNA